MTNSRNTIYSIKRFMGRKFDEVREEIKRVPCKVVRAANGDAAVEVEVDGQPKQFSPPEISAKEQEITITASKRFNETWQAVSAELYRAASEKARAGQGPAGGQSGTQPGAGGAPEGSQKDESPIIDAEVVDDKKAA